MNNLVFEIIKIGRWVYTLPLNLPRLPKNNSLILSKPGIRSSTNIVISDSDTSPEYLIVVRVSSLGGIGAFVNNEINNLNAGLKHVIRMSRFPESLQFKRYDASAGYTYKEDSLAEFREMRFKSYEVNREMTPEIIHFWNSKGDKVLSIAVFRTVTDIVLMPFFSVKRIRLSDRRIILSEEGGISKAFQFQTFESSGIGPVFLDEDFVFINIRSLFAGFPRRVLFRGPEVPSSFSMLISAIGAYVLEARVMREESSTGRVNTFKERKVPIERYLISI